MARYPENWALAKVRHGWRFTECVGGFESSAGRKYSQTLSAETDLDEEMRHLVRMLCATNSQALT
ncbi:MAG: hypothetical protein M2R45_00758 [Verrucomicrobia subdivision 3 bacterium]|nr:hypothetical protein [Limisphaerales bacterium]MCS1413136.1 hypothetical protein [Limisphaerales bacterium]